MTPRVVKLGLQSLDIAPVAQREHLLVFAFTRTNCSVRSTYTGRVQELGDVAAQFLIDELKGYGWKEIA